jgi:hypothetical protein
MTSNTEERIDYHAYWKRGMSYTMYRALLEDLLARGETTGSNQSPEMLEYARLNNHRMDRIEKRFHMLPEMQAVLDNMQGHQYWLVISEGWCGDAAQNLPALQQVAAHSQGHIELRVLLRDENLELMDLWLTGKSRSIPKLIILDEGFSPVQSWGPRPAEAQKIVMEARLLGESSLEYNVRLHKWYSHNAGQDLQLELIALLSK